MISEELVALNSSDGISSNPVVVALSWLEGTLTGTIATSIAVLAIASIGLLMLGGRIDVRRSAQVILGCFIIFGASTIASGIHSAIIAGEGGTAVAETDQLPHYPLASPTMPQSVPGGSDPYSGAAVPRQ